MRDVPSFHFDMDVEMTLAVNGNEMDIPIAFTGDFQAPDRIKAFISLTLPFTDINTEVVEVEDITYVKNPGTGNWDTIIDENVFFITPNEFIGNKLTALNVSRLAGVEPLGKRDYYILKASAPPGILMDSENDVEISIWIGTKDSIIKKVALTGDIRIDKDNWMIGNIYKGGIATINLTTTFSDFETPVMIEPPEDAPLPVEVKKSYEWVKVQTAFNSMMTANGISSVTRSEASTNDWSEFPIGPGAVPLLEYMTANTKYLYCWDNTGKILFQDETPIPCFPPGFPP